MACPEPEKPMRRRGSPARRAERVRDACRGIAHVVRTEPHARAHVAAATAVVGLGLWLRLSPMQWSLIWGAIGLVWVAEALNTAIERLCDAVHPEAHPLIGRAKDAAAGAVLLASAAAAAIGLWVLGPAVWERLSG